MLRLSILLVVLGVITAQSWDEQNDPLVFSPKYQYQFGQLPLASMLPNESLPWSEMFWPNFAAGIAQRWYNYDGEMFGYHLYSKQELKNLTTEEKMKLSPAEKFDILNQRYDYPTVYSEWNRTHPEDPFWTGLCHGWAPASVHKI